MEWLLFIVVLLISVWILCRLYSAGARDHRDESEKDYSELCERGKKKRDHNEE